MSQLGEMSERADVAMHFIQINYQTNWQKWFTRVSTIASYLVTRWYIHYNYAVPLCNFWMCTCLFTCIIINIIIVVGARVKAFVLKRSLRELNELESEPGESGEDLEQTSRTDAAQLKVHVARSTVLIVAMHTHR